MQDRIVLGFLFDGGKTGYEIKKLMEITTSNFFNTSLGSIYPALKKLEKNKMVRMEEKVEKGRLKKLYSITPKGKKHFHDWLTKEPSVIKIRAEALLKIFFFSYVSDEVRNKHVDVTMSQLEKQIEELKDIKKFAGELEVDYFQMLCLKYGIDVLAFMQSMLGDLRKDLKIQAENNQKNKELLKAN